jgi:hypothetical protein
MRRLIILLAMAVAAMVGIQAPAYAGDTNGPSARDYVSYDVDRTLMCHDWQGSPGDGKNEPGTCKTGGDKEWLYSTSAGNLSGPASRTDADFHWADTDGFYVEGGWDVAISIIAIGPDGPWHRYKASGWRKVGGCFNCNTKLKTYPQ